jgi:hypothetical protein
MLTPLVPINTSVNNESINNKHVQHTALPPHIALQQHNNVNNHGATISTAPMVPPQHYGASNTVQAQYGANTASSSTQHISIRSINSIVPSLPINVNTTAHQQYHSILVPTLRTTTKASIALKVNKAINTSINNKHTQLTHSNHAIPPRSRCQSSIKHTALQQSLLTIHQ